MHFLTIKLFYRLLSDAAQIVSCLNSMQILRIFACLPDYASNPGAHARAHYPSRRCCGGRGD